MYPVDGMLTTAMQADVKISVQVLDLKDSYEKGQSRRKANSQQRLLDGEVNFDVNTSHAIQVSFYPKATSIYITWMI